MRHRILFCLVLSLGSLCIGDAQAAAVCSNTPGDGDRIFCEKDNTSNDDINIDVDGVAISTTGPGTNNKGVWARHAGGTATTRADITIDITGTATKNTITTTGPSAEGISGAHTGIGNVDIDVTDVEITTGGDGSPAVSGTHTGTGDVGIDLTGIEISTTSTGSPGVWSAHEGTGNIDINIEGKTTRRTISTTASPGHGVRARHYSTGNVDIEVEDIAITTTGAPATSGEAKGIFVEHSGTGYVDIDLTGVSISTQGSDTTGSDGVFATHSGSGNIDLTIEGKTTGSTTTPSTITTIKPQARGIFAQKANGSDSGGELIETSGNVTITLDDIRINTGAGGAAALYAQLQSKNSGTLTATLKSGVDITTQGSGVILTNENDSKDAVDENGVPLSYDVTLVAQGIAVRSVVQGLRADRQNGDGDITIDVDGSTITTEGNSGYGIYGYHVGDENDGSIIIDATNGSITTGSSVTEDSVTTLKGYLSFGIYTHHQNTDDTKRNAAGDIRITTRNFDVSTTGTAIHPSLPGTYAYGIYAVHRNSGDIDINLGQGSSVTTDGQNSHGVVTYHYGTAATRTMDITLDGPVMVNGAGTQGVRVGVVSSGAPQRVAALDDEGYRRHTVTVNSSISSQGEGIYLANGGNVIIGPRGSIRSGSGIAILATGTVPEVPEDNSDPLNIIPAVPAILPKLRVDLNLGGRRVSQALGDDWILNDGGETTIAMNGVVLHDGATGATDETARNGAYNVRMAAGSVKVTDRTNEDPAMWVVSDRAEDVIVIADRDFSAADFSERRRAPPSPPPPPPEPDPPAVDGAKLGELVGGAVVNALNSIISAPLGEQEASSSPSSSPFIEVYAPRAAVYEALPTALLSLNDAGQGPGTSLQQGTFTFARTLENHGGLRPADSTVGQRHSLGYGGAQFGKRLQLGETLGASVALHRVWSTVDVEAGTGGGEIGVEATGLSLDGEWDGPEGLYARAGLSMTHYRLGTWSEDRDVGMLAGGVGARGSLARIEAGREVSLGGGLHVAPRLWFKRSALSVDDFTDAVGSRVSIPGTSRVFGGIGLAARAERRAGSGMLSLRGSADLVHVLDGRAAVADVSGARLTSQAEETELRLALSGVYRQGRFSLAAEASLNGADPGDARGAVGLRLAASF